MSQVDGYEPPSDPEQRSVIDKLAQFVARNGPDFERMTMEKQQGNPQFAFLFGGEYSDYYKHKVDDLKKSMPPQPPPPIMPQQPPFHPDSMGPPQWGGPPYNRNWEDGRDGWSNAPWPPPPIQGSWGPNWGPQNGPPPPWCPGPYPPNFYPPPPPPAPTQQTPSLTEEDVKRSEVNLKAQYDKIIGEEKPQAVRQYLAKARMDSFTAAATALSVNPEEFSGAIQPLIELCTKENIAKGKNWSVDLMSRGEAYSNLVADYLLLRVQNSDATFETRLHIVYLINDLLHYLKRHSDVSHFQSALNRIVVPVYSLALEMADEEKKVKLTRVLSLWETNAYLSEDVLKNMKEEADREAFMKEWRIEQDKVHEEKIAELEAAHTTRYEALKKQHDDFAEHVHKTIAAAAAAETEHTEGGPLPFPDFTRYGPPPPPPQGFGGGGGGGGWVGSGGSFDPPPRWHGPPPFMTGPPPIPGRGGDRWGRGRGGDMPPFHPDEEFYDGRRGGPPPPPMQYRGGPSRDRYRRDGRFDDPYYNHYHHQDDRPYRGGLQHRRRYEENEEEVHHSRPTENHETEEETEHQKPVVTPSDEDLIPKVPFWQLPAGLMHPLIGPKDFDFTPLNPAKLRLLPPEPPSEQLMLALDAYYVQPSHDRPRDPEGWERLGLFEFYRAKEEAKNRRESEDSVTGTDEEEEMKSGSVSPTDRTKNRGLPQLAYLTAYPKSAIGQAIRTGPAALIATPPPNLGLPKMNAQFAAAAAAAANPAAGSGDSSGGILKYPPSGMPPSTQQNTTGQTAPPTQLISRASRFTSATRRRSRSRSRSYSRSRSRSRSDSRSSGSRSRSSSRSRSRSRSSRSRSRSPSDRRYRDRSRSPRSTDGSITTAGFMRRSGGDQRSNRRGGMAAGYPPPQHPNQWSYDHPPPPPPMMSPFDRHGGPPGQIYPPYGSGGGGYRGNGYGASSPPPPPIGNGQRGGGPYYSNVNRRGGAVKRGMVRVCVVGCLHGQLDRVYADIEMLDKEAGKKTELVLCCGDFQAVRNPADLQSVSVPPKYFEMGDFYRYYSEEVVAPILTIFVGGNHEASNYLQELPYGGWVAPNIWYMGYAGIVQFAGLRIGGLSGIYKLHDYCLGHFEHPPYNEATKRSVYHLRNLEVFRLGQISRRLDIMLSHDWPRGIYHYGDLQRLLARKRHFRAEVEANTLGSPPGEQLLCRLRPRFWFAAHLHCKFAAIVRHKSFPSRQTKFLALDKCLPSRDYLQFLDIDPDPGYATLDAEGCVVGGDGIDAPIIVTNQSVRDEEEEEGGEATNDPLGKLFIDPEWMCILHSTNEFLSLTQIPCMLPGQDGKQIRSYSATMEELKSVHETFAGIFSLPRNFERTAPIYKPEDTSLRGRGNKKLAELAETDAKKQKQFFSNPQTELICAMLEVTNPNAVLLGKESYNLSEMATRLRNQEEEEEHDDIGDGADSTNSDEVAFVPSPSKFARVLPNPEEINLDDTLEYDPASVGLVGTMYRRDSPEVCVNENEYKPEPVVKNPEVIDIDAIGDYDGEADESGETSGKEIEEPEAYEPHPISGCGIDPGVTYDPQPVSVNEAVNEGGEGQHS